MSSVTSRQPCHSLLVVLRGENSWLLEGGVRVPTASPVRTRTRGLSDRDSPGRRAALSARGPLPNQRPLAFECIGHGQHGPRPVSHSITYMGTSGNWQDTGQAFMGTFSGTFSEKAQGVLSEPIDFIGGRRWYRTTDPLLVRHEQRFLPVSG